ncbi:L-aminoadipate-semialdehyde dehydrogenase-phosphopantetheinyl transferase [Onthophagus taurus]|uniref:L-aminoadipate-semialdehyde dehydrogenase-phosphopantetheinyl transferase n=1 Tax=Onthophagus taurus TaxID=166361 RepID=UPI0039BDEEF2
MRFFLKITSITSKMSIESTRWCFNSKNWNPTHSEMLLSTSCVQSEEKDRLIKFVFKDDFKSSLIGRLMMRKFVSESTQLEYNKIRFKRDDKGKPILIDPEKRFSNLSFNVSHQGDYVVIAGEKNLPNIGVDVMKIEYSGSKSLSEFFRIMNRQFSQLEWLNIKGCGSEREQLAMFCRHWSLKESYVKAIGVGITINLQDISFKINTKRLRKDVLVSDTELFIKNQKVNWEFQEMLLNDDHCVSVALNKTCLNENFQPKSLFREISFEELTKNSIPLLESDEEYVKLFFNKIYKKREVRK